MDAVGDERAELRRDGEQQRVIAPGPVGRRMGLTPEEGVPGSGGAHRPRQLLRRGLGRRVRDSCEAGPRDRWRGRAACRGSGRARSVDLDRRYNPRTARIGALDQLERCVLVRISDRVDEDAVSVSID
jgi:hypothetical protein